MIYAADPNATPNDQSGDEPSQRPFEAVIPLATHLGKTPDTTYAIGQEVQLAATVMGQTGVVLIAWKHKAITRTLLPTIAKGLTPPQIPTKWDGTRFDVVFR